ncbi:MAG TPA: hypothetical protein VFM05_14920 [Candidatus Saccharimonadales bacterium]|nr:hypothetical protein [Candidatus Saccharimonadales bacterium]
MRYFLGFLAAVGLIIFVFILVLRGFSGDSKTKSEPLTDYAGTDALVRMTVDGPIVADQQHQAYRITVSRSEARIETLQGYEYNSIETKNYVNNQQSFTNFLRALDLAGYTRGLKKTDRQSNDERGVCATGSRFVFEIVNGTSEIQRYWSTSCSGQGTFRGNAAQVKQLFDRQIPIPDFPRMTSRLRV